MSLRLTVLGGAAAWPNPGQGCSSYLIESDARAILLDCGPDTLIELRKHIDYTAVDAILISHCHSDHAIDALAEAFGGSGEPANDFWTEAFDLRRFEPSGQVAVGDLTITFCPTQHFIPCYAMRVVDRDGRSLVYSADTGAIDSLLDFAAGADVLISEATLPDDDTSRPVARGHLTPTLAGQFAAQTATGTLVLTHLWSERDDQEVQRAAAQVFEGRIEIAKPGLRIDV
jgi:ribonuclease BN (tRNA processing enzyme)